MYWSRGLLKENAKKVLSASYWRVFAVCLVAGLLGGSNTLTVRFSTTEWRRFSGNYYFNSIAVVVLLVVALIVLAISFVWLAFVGGPILVGRNRFLMENRAGFPTIESMFSTFRSGKDQYLNIVKVMFQYQLEIFLWSLLCVIPGIYKSYQYYYVPFLLAENPYMTYSRAKELSRAMTENEKLDIWVLQLSFFGWFLLGTLACGIGTFFVVPYQAATTAELYAAARAKAFSIGITGPDELADFTRY